MKTTRQTTFEIPKARKIEIDTSVSLLMTSTPPGNPGLPGAPGFNPPAWGGPQWAENEGFEDDSGAFMG